MLIRPVYTQAVRTQLGVLARLASEGRVRPGGYDAARALVLRGHTARDAIRLTRT